MAESLLREVTPPSTIDNDGDDNFAKWEQRAGEDAMADSLLLTSQLRRLDEEGNTERRSGGGLGGGEGDESVEESEEVRELARRLWVRRVGVLSHGNP